MEGFLDKLIGLATTVGGKLLLAIVVLVVGLIIIKAIKKALKKKEGKSKLDKTVANVINNLVIALLYVILVVAVVEILGVPMTSVTALLASCGIAVGLALQGALGNFAGGIMILIFKPFKIGDYINATGAEGTVSNISIFYTSLLTIDNKRVVIPNGDLMNSNVTNFSCEEKRRVDIEFKITNDIDEKFVRDVLLKAAEGTKGVIKEPAPFARLLNVDDDTFIFVVRAWCESASYWDVYFDLLENCSNALGENGIDDPEERIAVRLVKDEK